MMPELRKNAQKVVRKYGVQITRSTIRAELTAAGDGVVM